MGFFLGLLKLLFGKREPWTPLLMLRDCEDDEGPQLRFDCEGDYTGECCEILDRLCAGRFAVTWMEDLSWVKQRQEKKTRKRRVCRQIGGSQEKRAAKIGLFQKRGVICRQ